MLKYLSELLQEGKNEKLSSSRLLLLAWRLGTLLVWTITSFISVKNGEELQSLPDSIVTILGILVG